MREPTPAKAVVKTMKILECLSRERSFGITEIARLVSADFGSPRMNKSTVYRFLTSLKELGFVRQDAETDKYSLTLRLFEIGMSVLDRLELWREAGPVLKEIGGSPGRRSTSATLDESRLVYIGKIESAKTLRVSMMSRVGRTAPTYCTALGKDISRLPPAERVEEMLRKEEMVRLTAGPSPERRIWNASSPPSVRRDTPWMMRSTRSAFAAWPHRCGTTRNSMRRCERVGAGDQADGQGDPPLPTHCHRGAHEISRRMGYTKKGSARASGSNGRTPATHSMNAFTRRI